MFGNVALDVSIGLVFIFLLYSLLATILQEFLARIFSLRARMLLKSIRIMLEDRNMDIDHDRLFIVTYAQRVGNAVWENLYRLFCPLRKVPFAQAFFSHPAIKYLSRSAFHSKPSYIGATNFSDTVIQLLRGHNYRGEESQMDSIRRALFEDRSIRGSIKSTAPDTPINDETLARLQQLYIDAQGEISRFRALLERWFNDTMDRANGWYLRQTQIMLMVVGLFVAYSFNVDAIAITRILATDKKARENLVQMAISRQEQYGRIVDSMTPVRVRTTTTTKDLNGNTTIVERDSSYIAATDSFISATYKSLAQDAEAAHNILGLGAPYRDTCKRLKAAMCAARGIDPDTFKNCVCLSKEERLAALNHTPVTSQDSIRYACAECLTFRKSLPCWKSSPRQRGGGETLVGWFIAALAISLGAPFWFDLLNKLIKVRATGTRPEPTATAERSAVMGSGSGSRPVNPEDIRG